MLIKDNFLVEVVIMFYLSVLMFVILFIVEFIV